MSEKRCQCDCIDEKTLHEAIKSAIVAHEIRVAIGSGIIGAMLLIGTWHAIWILHKQQ
jgi:hypothetical protein